MTSTATENLAPIALFVFKRPEHTRQTLASLADNPEFNSSPLYIYCDGARNEKDLVDVEITRDIIGSWEHPNKTIITQKINCGLANSVIAGVTALVSQYGRVIVVEDDLVVSKYFLSYLNSALDKYYNSRKVLQISAYMFPVAEFSDKKETMFLPFITSWGWATWSRAWEVFDAKATHWECLLTNSETRKQFDLGGCYDYSGMLLRQVRGEIDSWAIRWNWSVFQHNGLVIYPPTSLVKNIGFDGSGTHCRPDDFHDVRIQASTDQFLFSDSIEISSREYLAVKKVIKTMSGSFLVRFIKITRSKIQRMKMVNQG